MNVFTFRLCRRAGVLGLLLTLLPSGAYAQEFTRATRFDLIPGSSFIYSVTPNGQMITGGGSGGTFRADTSNGVGTQTIITGLSNLQGVISHSGGWVVGNVGRYGLDGSFVSVPIAPQKSNLDASVIVGNGPSYEVISPEPNGPPPTQINLPTTLTGIARGVSAGGQTIVGTVSTTFSPQGFLSKPSADGGTAPDTFTLPYQNTLKSTAFYDTSADPFGYAIAGSGHSDQELLDFPYLFLNGTPVRIASFSDEGITGGVAYATSDFGEVTVGGFSPSSTTSDRGFVYANGQTFHPADFLISHGLPSSQIPTSFVFNNVFDVGVTRTTITLVGNGYTFGSSTPVGWIATVPNTQGYLSDEVLGNYWRGSQAFNKAYGGQKVSYAEAANGYYYLGYWQYFSDLVANPNDKRTAQNHLYTDLSYYGFLYFLARGNTQNAYAAYNYYQGLVQ